MTKILFTVLFLLLSAIPSFVQAGRLGDLSDEQSKKQRVPKNAPVEADPYTPEERRQLVKELTDDTYQKAVEAERRGRLGEAKKLFEKVLILTPNHLRAQNHLNTINRTLEKQQKAKQPAPVKVNAPVVEENPRPVKKAAPKKVTPPEVARKRSEADRVESDEYYFRALEASQNKDKEKALELCKKALKLNPNNLQAQRMFDRLSQ